MFQNFLRTIKTKWSEFVEDTKVRETSDELFNKIMTLPSDAAKAEAFDIFRGRFETYLEVEKAEKTSHLLELNREIERIKKPVILRESLLMEVKDNTGRKLKEIIATSQEENQKLIPSMP